MPLSARHREILDVDRMALQGALQSILRVFDENQEFTPVDHETINAIDAVALNIEKAIEKLKEVLR